MRSTRNRPRRSCVTWSTSWAIPTRHEDLAGEVQRWRDLHDAAVRSDPAAYAYVQALERDFDIAAEASIPTADDLAADFEAFLRTQDDRRCHPALRPAADPPPADPPPDRRRP